MEGLSFDSEFQDIIERDLEVTAHDDNYVMTVDEQKPDKVVAKYGSSHSDAEYKIHSTSFLELDDDQFEFDKIEEVAYRLVQSVLQAAAEYIISERNVAEDIAANATAATMTENESGLGFMEAMNGSPTLESDKNDAEIHATDCVNDSAPDNSFIEGIFSSSSQSVGEETDEKIDSTDLLLENIEEDKFTASGVTTTNASVNSDLSDETSEQVKHEQSGNEKKLIELENTPLIRIQSTSDEEVGPDNNTIDRYQVEEEKDRDMVKCTASEDQSSQLRSLSENITYRPAFTQRNIEATKWFGQSTAEDKIWMKPLGKVDANAELERRKLIKAMTRRHNPDLVPKWQPPKEADWRDSLHQRQRESLKKYEERQRKKRERTNDCTSASDTQIMKDDTPSAEQLQSPPPTTNTYSPYKSSERSIVRESVVRSRDAINQWEMTLHEKNRREQLERKRLSLGKNKSEGEVSVSHSAEPSLPQQNVASSTSHSTTLTSENVERDSVDISQVRNRWRKMERESKMILPPTFTIKNGTCTKIKSNSFAVGSLFESKRRAEMNDVTVDAHKRGGIDREIRDAADREKEWKFPLSRSTEHAFMNTDNSSDLSMTTNHGAFTNIHSASSSTQKNIENDINEDASRDEIWKEIHSPEAIRENIVLHNTTSPIRHKSIDGNRTIDISETVTSSQSIQSPLQSSNSNQSTSIDKLPTNHQALSSSASDEYAINRKVEGILKELASTDPSQRNLVLLKTLESLGSNLMFVSDEKKEKKDDGDVKHERKEEWESMPLMTSPRNIPVDVPPSKIQQGEFAYKLRSPSLTSSVVSPRGWESKNRQVTSVLPSFPQRLTHEMESNSTTDMGAIKSPTKLLEPKPHIDTFRSPSKFPEFITGTSRVNEREFEKKATSKVNSPSKFPEFITVTSHANERELEKKTISEVNHSYQPQVAEESRYRKRDLAETNERPKSVHKTIPYESPYIEVTEANFKKATVTNQLQSPVSLKRYENQSTTKTQPIRNEHELYNCKNGPRFEISASKSPLAEVLEKEMNEAVEREEQWKKQQMEKEKEMNEAVEREEQWKKQQIDNSSQAKKAVKEKKKAQRNAAHRQSTGAKFTVRPLVSYNTRPYDSDR